MKFAKPRQMDEGWIQNDDARNLYREVRGTYEYDAATNKFVSQTALS